MRRPMRSWMAWLLLCVLTGMAPCRAEGEPAFHAIVVGVSDYEGTALDLRFAARDAEAMAGALTLGATRLFGANRTHVTLLATTGQPGAVAPTKKALREAFAAMAERARPEDVTVIYLAGHGVTLPLETDVYCYLTSEARGLGELSDPALRSLVSVTNQELRQWLGRIAARKQVVILDTCAAGAATDSLAEKRDISADQQRALARLREREGLHILLGCAADARSYEASRYGQGLLTYALLQGMKGAALREGACLDVATLFGYAADQVPLLARDVGGIQRPIIASPPGGSFDIGVMTPDDRARVPLATARPLVLRPALLDPLRIGDPLRLSDALLAGLRQHDATATEFVFVDTDSFPGAIVPTGVYVVDGQTIRVTLKLWQDGVERATITRTGDVGRPAALCADLVAAMADRL